MTYAIGFACTVGIREYWYRSFFKYKFMELACGLVYNLTDDGMIIDVVLLADNWFEECFQKARFL